MNDKVNVSEGGMASFLIGFAYNCGNGIRLSKENIEIIDKIDFQICPSITKEIFEGIENEIFERKEFLEYINKWYESSKESNYPQIKIKQNLFLKNHYIPSHAIKITQEMIFSFFCGISNSIPEKFTESQFFDAYDRYLNMIGKEFCNDVDLERLCDIENFLTSNQTLFEIRDSIIISSGIKPEWHYPNKTEPENEDEAMLRRFQEEFK